MLGRGRLRLPEAPAGRSCQSRPEGQGDSGQARARVLPTPSVTGTHMHTHCHVHTRTILHSHVQHRHLPMYSHDSHACTHKCTHTRMHLCTCSSCSHGHTTHSQRHAPAQLSTAHSGAHVLTAHTHVTDLGVTCTDSHVCTHQFKQTMHRCTQLTGTLVHALTRMQEAHSASTPACSLHTARGSGNTGLDLTAVCSFDL